MRYSAQALMSFWRHRRAHRREIQAAGEEWLARHGDRAYGFESERIHDAWRLCDDAERDRWMLIRAALREIVGR
jgi:hypothetical protein